MTTQRSAFENAMRSIEELRRTTRPVYTITVWASVIGDKGSAERHERYFHNVSGSEAYEITQCIYSLLGKQVAEGSAGLSLTQQLMPL